MSELLMRRLVDCLEEIVVGVDALQGIPFANDGYLQDETIEAANLLRRLGLCDQGKRLRRARLRHEDYDALHKSARELLKLAQSSIGGLKKSKRAAGPRRDVLTPPQAATRLGVDAGTVITWIKTGELKASNVGKGSQRPRYRIQRSDLDRFLKSRQPEVSAKRKRRTRSPAGEVEFF
jgi:excisionase family DNA binding protein